MNLRKKSLGVAVAFALLSTSAWAVSPYGNNTQKGSLLVFPHVEVTRSSDTLIRITNDSTSPVTLKCFWATTDRDDYRKKHKTNFTVDLTRNHPQHFWASDGSSSGRTRYPQSGAPFTPMSDGYNAYKGELKCWAVNTSLTQQIRHNHLVGTATIYDNANNQAWEYTATSFQGLPINGPRGEALSLSGLTNPNSSELYNELILDGTDGNYDSCPNVAIGNFAPVGTRLFSRGGYHDMSERDGGYSNTEVSLAGCSQDFRQAYRPYITKLTYLFWNEDEVQYSGTHQCADSWYHKDLADFNGANNKFAHTDSAYFRVEPIGDTQWCTGAQAGGVMGVIINSVYVNDYDAYNLNADAELRKLSRAYVSGTTMNGRGAVNGSIKYDQGDGEVVKR